jgi:hypothetical protein
LTVLDCYHNDLTKIIEARANAQWMRKLTGCIRYMNRHKRFPVSDRRRKILLAAAVLCRM